jgi:small subunit ribosomal protein S3
MGSKVHPLGFRLGYIKDWQSRWFSERNYTDQLHEDLKLRQMVLKHYAGNGVARVDIERSANRIEITIHTAKVGHVVGQKGENVDKFRAKIERMLGKKLKINVADVAQPELEAQLVAESIGEQINKRVSYKRAMKQAVSRSSVRDASVVPKLPVSPTNAKAACHCTHCVLTSTMRRCMHTPPLVVLV